MQKTPKVVGYIDLTPTWSEMLRVMLAVIEDGDAKGKATIRKEFERMAKAADAWVAHANDTKLTTVQRAVRDAWNVRNVDARIELLKPLLRRKLFNEQMLDTYAEYEWREIPEEIRNAISL